MTLVLFTASRKWRGAAGRKTILLALLDVVNQYPMPITVVHGAQTSKDYKTGELYGGDYLCGEIAKEVLLEVEEHPAHKECTEHGWEHSFQKCGRPGGPIRNQVMVDKLVAARERGEQVVCLAMPMGDSPGTRGCMAKCDEAGIKVLNYGF